MTQLTNQLSASYEFLFNVLGPDHPETWECWQALQRAIKGYPAREPVGDRRVREGD